jgi:hypothetical protein
MTTIFPGRFSGASDEPFVVFLIGMRVNKFYQLAKWTRVARAMPAMLEELKRDPGLGLLHAQFVMHWRGVATIQYWRSFEQLHAYAHARNSAHLPAWAEFNRRIGGNSAVGIWHETYTVAPGQFESIYVNMPRFGLGAAAGHLPSTGPRSDAKGRMAGAKTVGTTMSDS